ncbi:MAG: hypothetical protein NZ853_11150 [Leptospiraceae bacterium]|nr:hypothetical protein [Leptospiraceae bacterium]MDW7975487.1 hypothetical protein [Leptospiraceae bacterium]
MKVKIWKYILIFFVMTTYVFGQQKLIDREEERKEYPDLQQTEKILDRNIADAYKRLSIFGPLINLAKDDRAKFFKHREDPLDFRHTLKNIIYTPRNTYIRYVKETPEFLLVGFGTTEETLAKIKERIDYVVSQGVQVPQLQFKQRDGIELTQFDFIYDENSPTREVIGSRRKSLTLFYERVNQGVIDIPQDFRMTMVVSRIVRDNIREGIKDVELVIDPSPETDGLDDVVILHRYNQKPTNVIILGSMHNTPNYPHRVEFKRDFHLILLDHFNILYRMVDGFAKRDSNEYNQKVLEYLIESMEY